MQGRTALLITHRLVGLENVDEILVLDRGRIVERGSHRDLLAQNGLREAERSTPALSRGLYRRMWDLQNRVLAEVS